MSGTDSVPLNIHDRFEILEELGTGGYSKVYRARQTATGRAIALKILKKDFLQDPEILERFQREVFAVASISSPHVVALYDFGMSGEDFYIAMEEVSGCSLREVIDCHPWTAQDIYVVAGQIAEALQAAHKCEIVHRDLKPENVMLARVNREHSRHRVKVLDFGFAKLGEIGDSLDLSELTRAGTTLGTPQYMSPEQSRGQAVHPSMDLYALGVIVYELLTGVPPWDGPDPFKVMTAIVHDPLPPLELHPKGPHVALGRTRELSAFVNLVLAKEVKARPPDAESFLRALEEALFGKALGPGFAQVTGELVEIPTAPLWPEKPPPDVSRPLYDATVAMPTLRGDESSAMTTQQPAQQIERRRVPYVGLTVLLLILLCTIAYAVWVW